MQAVIFDMDGVLVDSEGLWQIAEKEVFSDLGVAISEELSAQTKSKTTREVVEFWFALSPWENVRFEEVEDRVVQKVKQLIAEADCVIAGVVEFIAALKDRGLKIGLATNSPYEIIPIVLEKLQMNESFDVIACVDDVVNGKPYPDIYLHACAQLKIDPQNAVALEDSNTGAQAALAAGMKAIGFTDQGKNQFHVNVDLKLDRYDISVFDQFLMRAN